MTVLRCLSFALLFWVYCLVVVPLVAVAGVFGQAPLLAACAGWGRGYRWLAEHVMGVRLVIHGKMPRGPHLIAIKHESAFEAITTLALFDRPAVVMKAELGRIPLWGQLARRHGAIFVDRQGSAAMLRAMARQARDAVAAGRPVVIFPEGTRVAPGEMPPLAAGFAGLYRLLDLPVIPVALDSGRVWPKGLWKRPGVVTMTIGAAIPPGLPRADIEARTHAAINALNGVPAPPTTPVIIAPAGACHRTQS